MSRKLSTIIGALFGCAPLAGCVWFVPGVDDLLFVDVQPVEMRALDLHSDWDLHGWPALPPRYVIGRISVVTDTDIHEIGEQSELNVWHELTICKTGALVVDWPGVYYKGVDINPNTSDAIRALYRDRAAAHGDDEPVIYDVYFIPRSTLSQPKGLGTPDAHEPYDFSREPLDLCLRIGGGNMLGGHFVSNTAVVPSAELGRALKNGQR